MPSEFMIHWAGSGRCGATLFLFFLVGTLWTALSAQELVPGAYTPAPVGVNLLTLSSAYNSGDVSFDPSLPVEDASARITAGSVGYARTFGFQGRCSSRPCVSGETREKCKTSFG